MPPPGRSADPTGRPPPIYLAASREGYDRSL